MKRKLYGNTVSPTCRLCVHGRLTKDKQVVLCLHRGVTAPDDRCRKFCYDPLRRVPFRNPQIETFSKEDFSLE